jgi:DUF1365 family protein
MAPISHLGNAWEAAEVSRQSAQKLYVSPKVKGGFLYCWRSSILVHACRIVKKRTGN